MTSIQGDSRKKIQSYRELDAWKKAYAFGLCVYRITHQFPAYERFGLVSQLRRGAVAVASNIAEGYGRGSAPDYLRFLKIARGALYELDTQLAFSADLQYISPDMYKSLQSELAECRKVIAGLIRSLG